MPSTGRGSMASTASENSLASVPVVCTARASTPANGPRPTATMNSIANTISLMARQASIRRRTGWCSQAGAMLADAASPSGTAATMASSVPQTAMCTVTIISRT